MLGTAPLLCIGRTPRPAHLGGTYQSGDIVSHVLLRYVVACSSTVCHHRYRFHQEVLYPEGSPQK